MSFIPRIPNDYLAVDAEQPKVDAIEINPQGGNDPIPVVYGLQRVEGPLLFVSTAVNNPFVLYMAVALSEGPCSKIYRIFLDGELVPFSAVDPLQHRIPNYPTPGTKFRPTSAIADRLVTIEFMDGRSGQLASSLLQEINGASSVNQPNLFPGISYVVLKLDNSRGTFRQMPKVTVDLMGRVVRDLNQYLINPGDPSYWPTPIRSTDPADCILDYLTNTTYGAGIPDSLVNISSFKTIKDYFEANTVVYDPNVGSTNLYTINQVIDTAKPVVENLRQMLDQYGLLLTFTNGQYRLSIDGATNTTYSITEADIVSEISIQRPDSSVKFNSFTVDYYFTGDRYAFADFQVKSITYPNADDLAGQFNAFLVQDGNLINEGQMMLPGVTNYKMAHQIARSRLLRSRNQSIYRFTMTKDAFQYTVGDVLSVTTTVPALTNQLMRIISIKINDDFTFEVECVSHSNSYFPPFSLTVTDPPISTIPPQTPSLSGTVTQQPTPASSGSIGTAPPTTSTSYPQPGDAGGVGTTSTIVLTQAAYDVTITTAGPNNPGASVIGNQPIPPYLTNAGRSGGYNQDFYLGRIEKGFRVGEALPVNNMYRVINPNIHSVNEGTTGASKYNFGVEHRVATLRNPEGGNGCYSLQMSPYITYRYQTQTPLDTKAGRYKGANELYYVYSISQSTSTGVYDYGFIEIEKGTGAQIQYFVDPQTGVTVRQRKGTTTVDLSGGLEAIYQTKMPRLFFRPNLVATITGGSYGGITAPSGSANSWLTAVQHRVGIAPQGAPFVPNSINILQESRFYATGIPATANIYFKIFHRNGPGDWEYLGIVQSNFYTYACYETTRYDGVGTTTDSKTNWDKAYTGLTNKPSIGF